VVPMMTSIVVTTGISLTKLSFVQRMMLNTRRRSDRERFSLLAQRWSDCIHPALVFVKSGIENRAGERQPFAPAGRSLAPTVSSPLHRVINTGVPKLTANSATSWSSSPKLTFKATIEQQEGPFTPMVRPGRAPYSLDQQRYRHRYRRDRGVRPRSDGVHDHPASMPGRSAVGGITPRQSSCQPVCWPRSASTVTAMRSPSS
jgi:hypothetical protein